MRAFLLVLTLLLCSLPHAARCEPQAPTTAEAKSQAEQFFSAGVSLQKSEDFEAAIAAYETSMQLFPTKSALFNLANCQRAAHRYADAWNSLHRLQTEFGTELVEPMSSTSRAQLEDLANLTGLLDVETQPPGVAITVDGKPAGGTPWATPLRVTIGQHVVRAELEGYTPKETTVRLSPRQSLKLSLTLDTAPPPTAPVTSPSKEPEGPPKQITALPAKQARSLESAPSPPKIDTAFRSAGWVGMALGVAGIAVGTRAGLLALDVDTQLDKVCEGGHCARSSGARIERLERLSTSASVFIGAGAVLLATGVTLVLWPSTADEPEQVNIGVGPSGLRVGGSF